jgi:hypothetical protein
MNRLSGRAPARKGDPCSGLHHLYPPPEWALFTEVRSSTGDVDVLRTADAIAVRMWGGGWHLVGFEAKTSRTDWLRELRRPEKSGPLKLFCSAWYLVVPAPWKHVVLGPTELPDRWGLIEVGTGGASVVAAAAEREAEQPTPGLLRALLRASTRPRESLEDAAPRVLITRPRLSREHVGLACGHVAPRPLAKVLPRAVPCHGCQDGRASDRAFIEAALEDATVEDLRDYASIIGRRTQRAA